jgi:hypothetical protein
MVETRSNLQSSSNLLTGIGALIGLILVMIGAMVVTHAAYMVWQLYNDPDAIIGFAQSLKIAASTKVEINLNGIDPLRLIAWPLIILVLLLQGKIGAWAIEAGARLLGTVRNK